MGQSLGSIFVWYDNPMQLIYVTGVEGSGKSTICKYIANNGYKAVDVDKIGLSRRYFKRTWKPTDNLPTSSNMSHGWFNDREWKIRPSDVQKLKDSSEVGNVFICGITENFDDIRQIADKVICLTLPRDIVIERILSRENNDFGKNETELEYILRKHQNYENTNKESGSIMIDASSPLSNVDKDILKHTLSES